jgi:hypothetical protein
MLGEPARAAEPALEKSLADDSPLVRVAAAEGLYQLGQVDRARAVLVKSLAHRTPFVRLRAMNALYRMGDDARPALPAIKGASIKDIYPADYLNRMVKYLPERLARARSAGTR